MIQSTASVNHLLAALNKADYKRFMLRCEPVDLLLNQVIERVGDKIAYVYFPIKSIVSLMKHVDIDKSLEVGMIGNEGMLGSTLLLGVDTTPFTSIVQKEGAAFRVPAKQFMLELEQNFNMQIHFKRYIKVIFSQLIQNAACTRFHVVEARLARLLLMMKDRSQSQNFHVTQESLAHMLGVRRVGVTKAAGILQFKKLISYSRGDIVIHDNAGLEAASCSCYRTDNETYQRILTN